jgi:hypothetical protein
MQNRRYALLAAGGLGILAAVAAPADEPASGISDHVRAADAAIVRESKAVGAAAKEGAHEVGTAAKQVGRRVAAAGVKVAHEVKEAAKDVGAKAKAAVKKGAPERAKKPVS